MRIADRQILIDTHGIRIGWLGNAGGYWPTTSGLVDHCERALKGLSTAGFTVEHSAPPPLLRDLWQCWITLRQHALSSARPIYDNPEHRQLMGPQWQWELKQGMGLTAWISQEPKVFGMTGSSLCRLHLPNMTSLQHRPARSIHLTPKMVHPSESNRQPWTPIIAGWRSVCPPHWAACQLSTCRSRPSAGQATGIQFMAPAGKDETLLQFAAAAEPILLGEA
ncbi:MAG: hypothetical protein CM15mP125_2720 [Gammaproteobacteria bacterium]|nr:MAG: hypothetical protein CM15mP125_2720 [Gammaproteobacteria bacterium]